MPDRQPLSFRDTLLLTVVPLVAAATGLAALVSHLYDRRVAEAASATVPRAEAMDLIGQERNWHLALFVLLLAIAVGVAAWLARRVGAPLHRLQTQAHALAAGEAATPIPEEGPAELRALAADFNRMAAAVAARQADLARSQAVMRSMFDHTSDLVTMFHVPPDGGPLVCEDANPATLAAAGLRREQVIGATFHSNLPKDEADFLEGRFREAADAGQPVSYDRRIDLPGGERWFHTVVIPLPGPDGRVGRVASFSRDLTEVRATEQALRESEEFLAGLVESATDAILAVDEHGTVILFNAAAEQLFRVPGEEAFGRPVGKLLPEGLSGPGGLRRVPARRGDGSEFPAEVAVWCLEAGGRPLSAAIVRDVSDRTRVEAELEAARAALRAAGEPQI